MKGGTRISKEGRKKSERERKGEGRKGGTRRCRGGRQIAVITNTHTSTHTSTAGNSVGPCHVNPIPGVERLGDGVFAYTDTFQVARIKQAISTAGVKNSPTTLNWNAGSRPQTPNAIVTYAGYRVRYTR